MMREDKLLREKIVKAPIPSRSQNETKPESLLSASAKEFTAEPAELAELAETNVQVEPMADQEDSE